MQFSDCPNNWNPENLHIPNPTWEPDIDIAPPESRVGMQQFTKHLWNEFKKQRSPSNPSPSQQHLLDFHVHSNDFLVFPSDKNMDFCVIEHIECMKNSAQTPQQPHHPPTTFRRRSQIETACCSAAVKEPAMEFIEDNKNCINNNDITFSQRSSLTKWDPFQRKNDPSSQPLMAHFTALDIGLTKNSNPLSMHSQHTQKTATMPNSNFAMQSKHHKSPSANISPSSQLIPKLCVSTSMWCMSWENHMNSSTTHHSSKTSISMNNTQKQWCKPLTQWWMTMCSNSTTLNGHKQVV